MASVARSPWLRAVVLGLALCAGGAAGKKKKGSKGGSSGAVDDSAVRTLDQAELAVAAANETLAVALLTLGVDICGDECAKLDRLFARAALDVRPKEPSIKFLRSVLDPSLGAVDPSLLVALGSRPMLPKLVVFREGEPTDYGSAAAARKRTSGDDGEADADATLMAASVGLPTSAKELTSAVLAEWARPTVQTLRTAKQTERFLHLDTWAAQHATDEPTRVVGFFPDTPDVRESERYRAFRAAAKRLQSMISFGECFDQSLQAKFLGTAAERPVVQVVKASKAERKLQFGGRWTARVLARFVASHRGDLVTDVNSQDAFTDALSGGFPAFLLLMPDEYEERLDAIMPEFKATATRFRDRITFIFGFKDTDPWPALMQSLGLPRDAHGAFMVFLGQGESLYGHDWGTAWLPSVALGGGMQFGLYEMSAQPPDSAHLITRETMDGLVEKFLETADAAARADGVPDERSEPEAAELFVPAGAAAGAGAGAGAPEGGGVRAAECAADGSCVDTAAGAAEPSAAGADEAGGAQRSTITTAPTRSERDEVKALLQKRIKALEGQLQGAREKGAQQLHALASAVRSAAPELDLAAVARDAGLEPAALGLADSSA